MRCARGRDGDGGGSRAAPCGREECPAELSLFSSVSSLGEVGVEVGQC